MNLFLKVGATDLFEDYSVVGGVRLSTNLNNNEYVLTIANYKDRLDKELVFHRVSEDNSTDSSDQRIHTNEVLYILTYPFSNVNAIRLTGTVRDDRYITMAIDEPSLQATNIEKVWGGLKLDYTYDNTRSLGVNLYTGTRYKLFVEYYNETYTNQKNVTPYNQNLVVFGFDFRHYIKISRTFIWANRLAASGSGGTDKLLYYLGGVDNWVNPTFNTNTNIDHTQNYVFQTLATPMRGFDQNIRNGTNFAIFNSELRFPVFKYFAKQPIKSDFINNFQVIAFTDAGTAWSGINPYSTNNSQTTQTITNSNGIIVVKVTSQNDPIIESFGFGIHTRLFGYFLGFDEAWGLENQVFQKPFFYFSIGTGF